jgi:hypothetical protein
MWRPAHPIKTHYDAGGHGLRDQDYLEALKE